MRGEDLKHLSEDREVEEKDEEDTREGEREEEARETEALVVEGRMMREETTAAAAVPPPKAAIVVGEERGGDGEGSEESVSDRRPAIWVGLYSLALLSFWMKHVIEPPMSTQLRTPQRN